MRFPFCWKHRGRFRSVFKTIVGSPYPFAIQRTHDPMTGICFKECSDSCFYEAMYHRTFWPLPIGIAFKRWLVFQWDLLAARTSIWFKVKNKSTLRESCLSGKENFKPYFINDPTICLGLCYDCDIVFRDWFLCS